MPLERLSPYSGSVLRYLFLGLSVPLPASRKALILGAGWSSPVARQAHNLKAAGSNPAPATNPYLPIFLLTY